MDSLMEENAVSTLRISSEGNYRLLFICGSLTGTKQSESETPLNWSNEYLRKEVRQRSSGPHLLLFCASLSWNTHLHLYSS